MATYGYVLICVYNNFRVPHNQFHAKIDLPIRFIHLTFGVNLIGYSVYSVIKIRVSRIVYSIYRLVSVEGKSNCLFDLVTYRLVSLRCKSNNLFDLSACQLGGKPNCLFDLLTYQLVSLRCKSNSLFDLTYQLAG